MNHTIHFPLTIYYDASCPLCAAEMRTLKAADVQDKLILVDCSVSQFDDRPFAKEGMTKESMLRLIHARDATGRWFKGVDVFEVAYEVSGFVTLARLWRHPELRPWWDRIYPWVARHRYTLSRLGFAHLFRMLVRGARRSAARAAVATTQGCDAGICANEARNRF